MVELLFYYLLPESSPPALPHPAPLPFGTVDDSTSASLPRLFERAAADFVPQTPTKASRNAPVCSGLSSSSRGLRNDLPSLSPMPKLSPWPAYQRQQVLLKEEGDSATPRTVRTVSAADWCGSCPAGSEIGDHNRTPRRATSISVQREHTLEGRQPQRRRSKGHATVVRTETEKKELLRQVMPNVDALEGRFRAMGLRDAWM